MSMPANAMMQMLNNPQNGLGMGGTGMAVQPGTGMMAGGPAMQQPMAGGNPAISAGMGGNPAMGGPQAGTTPNGMSQAQKMMMAQALMGMGRQGGQGATSAPQPLPMNVGRNT